MQSEYVQAQRNWICE